MGFDYHIAYLLPPNASPIMLRLVLVFAFAQAFHYAVWIRLVPELSRERKAPRSFSASYRALTAEFGHWVIAGTGLAIVVLVVAAVFALKEARSGYLRFALFHGYLELAFLAVAWLESGKVGTGERGLQ
jgi:hypothetical protein